MSVISGLFHSRYLTTVVCTRTGNSSWFKGLPTPPADILAAALTGLSRLHQRKVAVKNMISG